MEDKIRWKKIDGYEYMVSTIGTVKRIASNKGRYKWEEHDIRAHYNNKGYAIVDLWRNNKRKQFLVHRLVAIAFIPNVDGLPEVNHKDENPKNNCVDNLEWCDRIYNMNYGSCPKRISKNNSKPIFQVNLDGSIVKQYPSVIQASKETGIPSSTIYDCTRGARKKAWGYIWKYAN